VATDPAFQLTKWYLDCVSEAGDAAIFYAAHVGWHGIHLHYSSLLCRLAGMATCRTSMRKPSVRQNETSLRVGAPQLEFWGEWRALEPQVAQELFRNNEGNVQWECFQPRAAAQVRVGNFAFEGLGYAERLSLTIPPWRLPLGRLQWGRWLSPTESLVWIDWSGAFARRWAWRNTIACRPDTIKPSQIRLDDTTLQLDRAMTLRKGRLGTTVVPAAPLLARVFPRAMFRTDETKWLSQGHLSEGSTTMTGWAIHEIVEWHT
jgi:hypothetical protein